MMAAVAETVERFGGLDVAVANAGIAPPTVTTTRTMPPEEWERVVDVNLMGVWHTVRAALPQVSERRASSSSSARSSPSPTGYAGQPLRGRQGRRSRQLGRALRVELAPFGASATVAYFGWVDTELVREARSTARRPASGSRKRCRSGFLLERITPEEAGAALVRGIEERAPRVFAPRWLALRLGAARAGQPAARPADGDATRKSPRSSPRDRRRRASRGALPPR